MSDLPVDGDKQRVFTGWHMLAIMVAFFGVVVGVNFFMAYSAIHSWTGLVVENSYVASQEFNTKLKNARAQAEMGWKGGLEYADGQLVFTLVGPDGAPLEVSEVSVHVSRPIGMQGDVFLALNRAGDGTHVTQIDLAPGVWNAQIVASFADQPDYEHHARLIVGPQS